MYPWQFFKPSLDGPLSDFAQYDPNFTILCLLAINSIVFLMWKLGHRGINIKYNEPVAKRIMEATNAKILYPHDVRTLNEKISFRIGQFLERHFVFSHLRIFSRNGWHTAFTSVFSHMDGKHLLKNMFSLWLFGGMVHETVGRDTFLGIYFGACEVLIVNINAEVILCSSFCIRTAATDNTKKNAISQSQNDKRIEINH